MTRITVNVDGVAYEDDVEPRLLLVHYLRETVGKTGDNGYCADENNTIRKDPAGGTNCTQPLQ